ncbi:hypothetical protein PENSPDRAFT_421548 [Peniophora sp. CONT]|nr:hypothetical protein PENSPDRAFT_421548 [Peniophora sp. CONT]
MVLLIQAFKGGLLPQASEPSCPQGPLTPASFIGRITDKSYCSSQAHCRQPVTSTNATMVGAPGADRFTVSAPRHCLKAPKRPNGADLPFVDVPLTAMTGS